MSGEWMRGLHYLFPIIAFALGNWLIKIQPDMINGYGYASTMCIGNLRSGTESLSIYLREKKPEILKKALHYYGIIFVFAIGAGIGGILSLYIGIKAIWVSSILLATVFVMMFIEKM